MSFRGPGRGLIGVIYVCALLLAGCDKQTVLESLASDEDKQHSTRFIQDLRAGRVDVIYDHLEDNLKQQAGVRETLRTMYEGLPKREPDSVKLVGVNVDIRTDSRFSNLTYEYEFGDQWILINCATRRTGDEVRIWGIHVNPRQMSLEEENRFVLAGKPATHYLMLAGMALAVALTLFSLILCIRHKGLRRKWAWVLFIIFGVGQLQLDWNSGAWAIQWLHFQLFSAGAVANPYGPWVLTVSWPLGAILYLIVGRGIKTPRHSPTPGREAIE